MIIKYKTNRLIQGLSAFIVFFFLATSSLFALENPEIEKKIYSFEKGLVTKNINLVMQSFKKDAVWQGVMTYPYVKENATELFNYYKSINLQRIRLELSALDQRIASSADYLLRATTMQGKQVELKVSFVFLWEKGQDEWQIIAINPLIMVPVDGSVADDLKKIDPGNVSQDSQVGHLSPVADSHVYAYAYRNWNKANWGKYGSLGAGWHPTGGEKRTYLRFDLSGIDPNIVKKATLKLYHNHTGGRNSLSVGVHAVTSAWQEGVGTYHSGQTEKPAAPGEISWVQQPTFDFSPMASFKPGSEIGKYLEVDITPLVKAWLSGKPNYGLIIKPVGIMSGRAPESSYGFYSREHQDMSKRPVLVLSASSISDTPTGSKHPLGDITRITDYPQAAKNIRGAPCGIDRTFVFSLFQCILERDPENREIDEQIRDLQSGMSRKEIVIRFFKSREYLNNNKTGSESYKDAYQAVLGRNPSSNEMRTFPRTYPFMMAVKLFDTEEYRNLCQPNTGGNLTTTSTGTGSTGLTLDFETGRTNGWTKTGTAFNHQPTYGDNPTARRRGQPSKHVGNYWIGTYEKYQGSGSQKPGSVQGDGPTGTLTSNVFTIPAGSLSFLVGGGSSSQTRVELLVSGNSVLSVSGRGTETMHRVTWDLNPWAGQQGQIRLVDNASGGWGHINADDFRFSHSTPPQPDVRSTAIKTPQRPKSEPTLKPKLKPKPKPKPVSEDGYQSIGREGTFDSGQQRGSSERQRKIPKGHSTQYGF